VACAVKQETKARNKMKRRMTVILVYTKVGGDCCQLLCSPWFEIDLKKKVVPYLPGTYSCTRSRYGLSGHSPPD
jgi:hypothetical protein